MLKTGTLGVAHPGHDAVTITHTRPLSNHQALTKARDESSHGPELSVNLS